jgi:MFS family permease
MLVPGSLAIISTTFQEEDRGAAIGAWSGLSGVSTALGPFVGGWMVDAVSWRLVFFLNIPIAVVAILVTVRHMPETRDESASHTPDIPGALTATVGMGAVIYALIEGPVQGFGSVPIAAAAAFGVLSLAAFFGIEARRRDPMLPLDIFGSRQFSGANATTLVVYGALGGAMFLVVLQLQGMLGYSALEAGLAMLPVTFELMVLSPAAGKLAASIGPRIPMTLGPLVAGLGFVLMSRIVPGGSYFGAVLPGVVVFGLGMSLTVAPLTAAVLAAVETRHAGIGSGVNNAVARIAGLLAVALLPLAAGIAGIEGIERAAFSDGFRRAMLLAAALCALGGLVSWVTIRGPSRARPKVPASVDHPCACEPEPASAAT